MPDRITIQIATPDDLDRIRRFLASNELPDKGIEACLENFVLAIDQIGSLIGVAGLEQYGKSALLRSVAVDTRFRGQGHGRTLVERILKNAKSRGIETVYLLTDDANGYFERLGFQAIGRRDVDEAVKKSVEFVDPDVCPESALAMRRTLP
jgi:amino-acid N-acetyltransferase